MEREPGGSGAFEGFLSASFSTEADDDSFPEPACQVFLGSCRKWGVCAPNEGRLVGTLGVGFIGSLGP